MSTSAKQRKIINQAQYQIFTSTLNSQPTASSTSSVSAINSAPIQINTPTNTAYYNYCIQEDDDVDLKKKSLLTKQNKLVLKTLIFITATIFTIINVKLILSNSSENSSSFEGRRTTEESELIELLKSQRIHYLRNDNITFGLDHYYDNKEMCEKILKSISCTKHYPTFDLTDFLKQEEILSHVPYLTHSFNKSIVPKFYLHSFSILTRRSYKGGVSSDQHNQDRVYLLSNPVNSNVLMTLFDGHGDLGHVISEYASQYYNSILASTLQQTPYIQEALRQSFIKLDQALPPHAAYEAGCTAIVAYYTNHELYISHVGDSHVYVVLYHEKSDNVELIYHNRVHKPNNAQEQSRIEGMGGKVHIPPPEKRLTSRVIIPNRNKKGNVALAMSRSLGDWEGSKIGVISTPDVDVLNIQEFKSEYSHHVFCFVASDGMMDVLKPLIVAAHLASGIYNNKKSLLEISEDLIRMASRRWVQQQGFYRDDISIVVAKL